LAAIRQPARAPRGVSRLFLLSGLAMFVQATLAIRKHEPLIVSIRVPVADASALAAAALGNELEVVPITEGYFTDAHLHSPLLAMIRMWLVRRHETDYFFNLVIRDIQSRNVL
jgi:hypothetical protein